LRLATSQANQSADQPKSVLPSGEKRSQRTSCGGSAVGATGLPLVGSYRQTGPLPVPNATALPSGRNPVQAAPTMLAEYSPPMPPPRPSAGSSGLAGKPDEDCTRVRPSGEKASADSPPCCRFHSNFPDARSQATSSLVFSFRATTRPPSADRATLVRFPPGSV